MMNMLGDSPFAAFYRDHMREMCYFMGYFQWHNTKRGGGSLHLPSTWWAFFGPEILRDSCKIFFKSVGLAIGCMIARRYLIPTVILDFY